MNSSKLLLGGAIVSAFVLVSSVYAGGGFDAPASMADYPARLARLKNVSVTFETGTELLDMADGSTNDELRNQLLRAAGAAFIAAGRLKPYKEMRGRINAAASFEAGMVESCRSCRGTGLSRSETAKTACKNCGGAGMIIKDKSLAEARCRRRIQKALEIVGEPSSKDEEPSGMKGTLKPSSADNERIRQKLQNIVIPEIEFRQANIADIIAFFGDASREYDDERIPASERGINFVLDLSLLPNGGMPSDGEGLFDTPGDDSPLPLVTMKSHYVTIQSAFDLLMDMTGLKYRIENGIVRIVPRNAPDGPLIQRKIRISPELADAIYDFRPTIRNNIEDDPFALSPLPVAKNDWPAILEAYGMGWPIGSSVHYDREASLLVIVNTEDYLRPIGDYLQSLSEVSLVTAKARLRKSQELTRMADYLRTKGRQDEPFEVLQVLSKGKAICRAESDRMVFLLLYPTDSKSSPEVREGDKFKTDLIWCGSGTYKTVSNSLRTLPQFAIEIGDAIDEAIRQDIPPQ